MTMPASKWDLGVEHLNRLNGQGEGAEDMGAPAPPPVASESVDLFAPDAAEKLGLTLIKGAG